MAIGARMTITGVPRTPNMYGLFSVVTPTTPADPHWQTGGVQWETLPCRNLWTINDPDCDPATPTVGLPKRFPSEGPGLDEADPFTVYASYQCAPVGRTLAEAQDLATQQLQLSEQTQVEWILWSGQYGEQVNLPDSAEPVSAGPLDPVAALVSLEGWFHGHTGTVNGMQAYIHMGVGTATILASLSVLRYSGNTVLTPAGSRVIIGTGYGAATDNGDGTISDRMYITPPPFVYRSEIFTSTDRPGDLLDRRNNDLYTIAERTYLVGWDSCPTSYYADLTWTDPAGGSDDGGGDQTLIPLKITSPDDGGTFSAVSGFKVMGTGRPGGTVHVTIAGPGTEDAVFDVKPSTDGNWFTDDFTNPDITAGQEFSVRAIDQGGRTDEITVTAE